MAAVNRSAKIFPHFWYTKEAEEAAKFYTSIFPNSRVDRVAAMESESPSGPPGSVKVVDFTLFGQPFQAMSAGPFEDFNHSISMVVACDDQAELDRYHAKLVEGGSAEPCGWVRDRFGVSWQVVPKVLDELMYGDPVRSKRVGELLQTMKRIDIAALQAACKG